MSEERNAADRERELREQEEEVREQDPAERSPEERRPGGTGENRPAPPGQAEQPRG